MPDDPRNTTDEAADRRSEAVLDLLMSKINDAVLTIEDYRVVDCNPAALKALGRDRNSIIGRTPWELSPELQPDGQQSSDKARAVIDAAMCGKAVRFQWLHETPDGKPAWVDISLTRIVQDGATRTLAILRDTTEIHRQAALQARLATLSARLLNAQGDEIIESFKAALATIGEDYKLDRVSIGWYEARHPSYDSPIDWSSFEDPIREVLPSEMPFGAARVGRGEVFRVEDVNELPQEAALDKSLTLELGYTSVLSHPLRYGEKVLGSLTVGTVEPRRWDDETVAELGLFADLISNTAVRQWSYAELAGRERDLARSQEVAGVGSYSFRVVLDDAGRADSEQLVLSDEAKRLFSLDRNDVSVDEANARIHPEDEPRVRRAWRSLFDGGDAVDIQYRVVESDETVRHVRANASLDEIDEHRIARGFGTVMDVTDWVEANRKLEAALNDVERLKDQLQEENRYLRDEVRAAHGFGEIIGNSRKLRHVLNLAEQVAPTDVTVLVTGETGTGKELVARAIHNQSPRHERALICVNCAAISDELIESELFGHEKGAFTGAHAQRKGRFELANGGTLFLDEIGEMSGSLQSKLLRVIQEGEFERLGGSETLRTDVRIVAATNRDLMQAVDAGEYRADLYYRINSFPLHMPPLRERKGDIPLLAEYLLSKHAARLGKNINAISERMMRNLQRQSWPGNIRELESAIVRAIVTCDGDVLDLSGGPSTIGVDANGEAASGDDLEEIQRSHIRDVLERTGWKIEGRKGAACALGMPPSSLRSMMRRLGIERPAN